MYYTNIIRIQTSINMKSLNEISNSMDYLKLQLNISNLQKAMLPLCNFRFDDLQIISKQWSNMLTILHSNFSDNLANLSYKIKSILSNFNSIQKIDMSSFPHLKILYENSLFLKIADEMGFPIYMEIDTTLKDRLILSYKKNKNQCNKKEMCEIILDYYNDEYIDYILNGIKNVQVFNSERVTLIEEGIEAYQFGFYGSAASLFATQLSGMISDVYKELSTFHRLSNKEKQDLIISFNQNCKPNSEKGMLLQIVVSQSQGFIIWHKVLKHFLKIVYSSNEYDIDSQPQRHMICHGKQTNYNTKEMNLKLILCMDIITKIAWRVKSMKEECSKTIIDV